MTITTDDERRANLDATFARIERDLAEAARARTEATDAMFARIERDLAEAAKLRTEARWEPWRAVPAALGVIALGVFAALGAARAVGWL